MSFSFVASVQSPMITTPTKPSSWHATTPSVLTALSTFPKGNTSYQPLSPAPTVGLTHDSQKMGSMDYRPTSTLPVFRRSPETLNQSELQQTTRAVMDITCSQYPIFAWHVVYLPVVNAQHLTIELEMDILSSVSQTQKPFTYRNWIIVIHQWHRTKGNWNTLNLKWHY